MANNLINFAFFFCFFAVAFHHSATAELLCGSMCGVIRDQLAVNPDFGVVPVGSDPGIVNVTLGGDGTPVYAGGPGGTLTTMGEGVFWSWYHDVPEMNMRMSYNGSFALVGRKCQLQILHNWPIDAMLLGNEGQGHNYLFTYHGAALVQYNGGETLRVYSDDDAFVFINGCLVIDLGGIHPIVQSEINVDDYATSCELDEGYAYRLDVFHATRRWESSMLKIQTTMSVLGDDTCPPPPEEPTLPSSTSSEQGPQLSSSSSSSSEQLPPSSVSSSRDDLSSSSSQGQILSSSSSREQLSSDQQLSSSSDQQVLSSTREQQVSSSSDQQVVSSTEEQLSTTSTTEEEPECPCACTCPQDCPPPPQCYDVLCDGGFCDLAALPRGEPCDGGLCDGHGTCYVIPEPCNCTGPVVGDAPCCHGECQDDGDCQTARPCVDGTCVDGTCCFSPAPNGEQCDDQDACTENDECHNAACRGTRRTCNDDDACTTDTCDTITGCHNEPVPNCIGPCVEDSDCPSHGQCKEGRCGRRGICYWQSLNEGECDDHNEQTENDQCVEGHCVGTCNGCEGNGGGRVWVAILVAVGAALCLLCLLGMLAFAWNEEEEEQLRSKLK